jgi:uncharacterized protein (TIGR03083 family)
MALGTLDYETYLEHLRREGAAFSAAVRRAQPADVVRSYPGFRVAGLASHVGRVLHGADQCVRTGAFPWLKPDEAPEAVQDLYDWVDDRLVSVLDALSSTDPDTPVKHPFEGSPQVVGFLPRYLSTEVATHRWDAESATGSQAPLPADLSADGIDYTREVWIPGFGSKVDAQLDGVIRFRATDVQRTWLVWSKDGSLLTADEDGPADLEVNGPVSDLFLLLWKRIDLTTMTLGFAGSADASLLGRLLSYDYVISAKTMPFH